MEIREKRPSRETPEDKRLAYMKQAGRKLNEDPLRRGGVLVARMPPYAGGRKRDLVSVTYLIQVLGRME